MADKNLTMKELIEEIDFRLTHLEDIEMDNRDLMVKLIKQGNTIVKFLQQFEITELPVEEYLEEEMSKLPDISKNNENLKKTEAIKALVDDLLEKHSDLKEFEDELKKHKDKIIPGQVGES